MLFTQGKVDCSPEEVGFDSGRIETLNNHFQKMIDRDEIQSAAYCVSRKGKIILHGAVGELSYKKDGTPLLPTTIHQVASVTKTFTAVAVMKLIEDGLARLDTPVGEILPQFNTPPFNTITLFHLLTHTSGIQSDPGSFENKYNLSPWECIEHISNELEEGEEFDWIAASLRAGLKKVPGTEWQYCSFGFCILGAVIEKLSGQFAHDYIMDNIVRPLGLKDTGFDITPEKAKRFIVRSPKKEEFLNKIINGEDSGNEDAGTFWEKIPSTGGGMHSTPYDLVRWGNLMLNHGRLDGVRILGRKTLEKMTTQSLHNIPDHCWGSAELDRKYGIGFDMRYGPAFHYTEGTIMHEGAGACSVNIDLKEELVAAWFVPFQNDQWYGHGLYNVNNIIFSGLI